MPHTSRVKLGAIAVVIVFCLQVLSSAQFSVARISGRVVDESGAPLPGVTVTATVGDTRRQTITRADGEFELKNLPAGTYALNVALPGFGTERRTVQLIDAAIVNITMGVGRVGCIDTTSFPFAIPPRPFLIDPPVVDPRVPGRSDLVAYFVIDRRLDENGSSYPDCRTRYRATVLRTATSPRYGRVFLRNIDVLLRRSPNIEAGNEYIAWLRWRSDKRAFDAVDDVDGSIRRVERGLVSAGERTYSVEELFKIFEDIWVR
jgi:hypothetical protein